ncbi:NADH-quinone oxidoreductase subunit C [Cytophagaceae bacterium ABcell3]|nr:NADH-quinone oxidoreductase subunit C [Cytophagaceae bacterium ABcell3]
MTFQEIKELLIQECGEDAITDEVQGKQPQLVIPASKLLEVCQVLHAHENTYFDFLSCITGLDNGPEKGTMEVIYHLYSVPFNHHMVLKVILQRNNTEEVPIPAVPSLCNIWKTANWHERETWDLLGIRFEGHPDHRRILLPDDWQGFPLRKDYKLQDYYQGIKTVY